VRLSKCQQFLHRLQARHRHVGQKIPRENSSARLTYGLARHKQTRREVKRFSANCKMNRLLFPALAAGIFGSAFAGANQSVCRRRRQRAVQIRAVRQRHERAASPCDWQKFYSEFPAKIIAGSTKNCRQNNSRGFTPEPPRAAAARRLHRFRLAQQQRVSCAARTGFRHVLRDHVLVLLSAFK